MPFPIVYGIPQDTPETVLNGLRKDIVAVVAKYMGCNTTWVRPFFPKDFLAEPTRESDGCKTIFVELETAMFYGNIGEEGDNKAKQVTKELATVIWAAFNGRYEVEVFINNLNPTWRHLIKVKGE
jgi:hypothetical protein